MKDSIKVGSYVYRPYSQTYWLITDMYYREMSTIYKPGGARSCERLCVTAVKVLDRRLTKPTIKAKIKRDMPVECFQPIAPEWYLGKRYYQKEGTLWDLVCKNMVNAVS